MAASLPLRTRSEENGTIRVRAGDGCRDNACGNDSECHAHDDERASHPVDRFPSADDDTIVDTEIRSVPAVGVTGAVGLSHPRVRIAARPRNVVARK